MSEIWKQVNEDAASVVAQVNQALVQIVTEEGSIGAGTIWHTDGLIVTNAHVIMSQQARRGMSVILPDGRQFEPQILATDERRDIAALAISAHDLPTIRVGNSSNLRSGQYLMALGHPWGVADALTAGVVIGTGDRLPEQADGREWIALDLKMRPGHSGGPLFNADGELVGINTMIRGPEVSFAVPVNVVKAFLKETIGRAAELVPQAVMNDAEGTSAVVV